MTEQLAVADGMTSKRARKLLAPKSQAVIASVFLAVIVTSIAIVSSADSVIAGPPPQASPDSTTNLTLDLVPTYESASVNLSYVGDANGNNQAFFEYRPVGTSRWIQGMDMTVDRRASIVGADPNPWRNQWRASVRRAMPGTLYEVRVTLSDPDGPSGSTVTAQVRTWTDTSQMTSSGLEWYVATTGSDATGDGSVANPYKTIQKAVDQTGPGDTVYVKAGTYAADGTTKLTNSGQPDNYVTVRNFANDPVTLDFSNQLGCAGSDNRYCALDIYGSYIRISGFKILSSVFTGANNRRGILINSGAHDIVIDNNVFEVRGPSNIAIYAKSSDSVPLSDRPNRITIEKNVIHVFEPGDPLAKTAGPGVDLWYGGGSWVIRDNYVEFFGSALPGKHGRDCFGAHPNFVPEGGYWETDIYDNTCVNATDDGISMDGGGNNLRVWGNHISGTMVGISITPILVGPAYVFRNVIENLRLHWSDGCAIFKIGKGGTGEVRIVNNTFISTDRFLDPDGKVCRYIIALLHADSPASDNIYSFNNIWEYNRRAVHDKGEAPTMDYNLYWGDPELSDTFGRWDGTTYDSFADFQAGTGQEQHGTYGRATFADRANGDYRLLDGSLGIDSGAIIQGFNDPDSAWPFLGLAPDLGAFETGISDPNAPPIRFNPGPSGELASGTTQATLSLSTNMPSTCKYSQTSSTDYDSMPQTFQNTGGTAHTTVVGGLTDGSAYVFYVRCKTATANTTDFLISFSVRVLDTTPPVISNLQTNSSSNSVTVDWDTDENSSGTVAYGLSSAALDQSVSSPTAALSHSVAIQGLVSETQYFVQVTACNLDGVCASSAVTGVVTAPPSADLVVSNLTVASGRLYQVVGDGLLSGALVYTDRSKTFTTISQSVSGATYIKTANNDKVATEESFLSFQVNQDSRIYIAYDVRASTVPNWLSVWSNTGEILGTSDGDRDLYAKDFPAGTVILGGNLAAGASGSGTNYSVAIIGTGAVVIFPTFPGMVGPARDLDGDGLAEDFNGNGRLDFADVVNLYFHLSSPEMAGFSDLFDFNNDGSLGPDDVATLFDLIAL